MPTMKCPKCGKVNEEGQLVCDQCGTLFFNPSASTVHMRVDPNLLRLRRSRTQEAEAVASGQMIRLEVRGMSEHLDFEEGTEIILGRADLSSPNETRLDLSRYGAHERGVSREHALLRYSKEELTVTDLGSSNGTAVNMRPLKANQPQALHNGDELMLGMLTFIVYFERKTVRKKAPEPESPPFDDTRPMSKSVFSAQPPPPSVADAGEPTHVRKTGPHKKVGSEDEATRSGPLVPGSTPDKIDS